jgi:putative DNA primase/helicase
VEHGQVILMSGTWQVGDGTSQPDNPERERTFLEMLEATLPPAAAVAGAPLLDAIPAELRARRQWVTWRAERRPGSEKPTKVPYNARTGRKASSADGDTWSTFEEVCAVAAKYDGVGYMFRAEDQIVGIDLDGCRDPGTGALTLWAIEILGDTRSYTEISPSGRGLHILIRGTLAPGARKRRGIEMYDSARYFTMTGRRLEELPAEIRPPVLQLSALHAKYFAASTGAESQDD